MINEARTRDTKRSRSDVRQWRGKGVCRTCVVGGAWGVEGRLELPLQLLVLLTGDEGAEGGGGGQGRGGPAVRLGLGVA